MSTVVYNGWHPADCELSQFTKQQKTHFVHKHAHVTKVLAEEQQMALVVCYSVLIVTQVFFVSDIHFLQCTFYVELEAETFDSKCAWTWSEHDLENANWQRDPKKLFSHLFDIDFNLLTPKYSQTSPLGPQIFGRCWQLVVVQRVALVI